MKRIIIFTISLLLVFSCFSCRKEHVAPVNQLVKDLFCFKEGSTWNYYDSVSQTSYTMNITDYDVSKFAPKPKGGKKTYEWGEHIEISGSFFNEFKITIETEGVEKDNTAVFHGTYISSNGPHSTLPLRFKCDAGNNFDIDVKYLSECILNERYIDVYLFKYGNIEYYISKHMGLIRLHKENEFDLVLTSKNVVQ